MLYEIDFDPWEEEFAERLNEENRRRMRSMDDPGIDLYEEQQIERAMGGIKNVNSGTEVNRTEQGNDIRRMAG